MNSAPNTYESLGSNIVKKYEEIARLQQYIKIIEEQIINKNLQIQRIYGQMMKSNYSQERYLTSYQEEINRLRNDKDNLEMKIKSIESEIKQLEKSQQNIINSMPVKNSSYYENKNNKNNKNYKFGGKKRTTKKKTTKKTTKKRTTKKRTTKK